MIRTKPATKAYRDGWERTYGGHCYFELGEPAKPPTIQEVFERGRQMMREHTLPDIAEGRDTSGDAEALRKVAARGVEVGPRHVEGRHIDDLLFDLTGIGR